jgi:hypothetical protein
MMNTKLERLEKKFNIASDMIKEFEINDTILVPTVMDLKEVTEPNTEIFDVVNLKQDFQLIRTNILGLITTGQRILNSVSILDPSDMKASQIQAVSDILKTVGENSKILFDLYKQMAEIESLRNKKSKFVEPANQTISTGNNITTNQILFTGSSDELLKLIKDNQ